MPRRVPLCGVKRARPPRLRRPGTTANPDRTRYCDPLTARFTQPDTIVPDPTNPQQLNRHSYVLNNPVRYTDPTGNYCFTSGPLKGECFDGGDQPGAEPDRTADLDGDGKRGGKPGYVSTTGACGPYKDRSGISCSYRGGQGGSIYNYGNGCAIVLSAGGSGGKPVCPDGSSVFGLGDSCTASSIDYADRCTPVGPFPVAETELSPGCRTGAQQLTLNCEEQLKNQYSVSVPNCPGFISDFAGFCPSLSESALRRGPHPGIDMRGIATTVGLGEQDTAVLSAEPGRWDRSWRASNQRYKGDRNEEVALIGVCPSALSASAHEVEATPPPDKGVGGGLV